MRMKQYPRDYYIWFVLVCTISFSWLLIFRLEASLGFGFTPTIVFDTRICPRTQPATSLFVSSRPTSPSAEESSKKTTMMDDEQSSSSNVIRILALHGSGGTAEEFPKRLMALDNALAERTTTQGTTTDTTTRLEITPVQGPFDMDDGYSWWTMPPGVRSFNAKEYTGFEESASRVLNVWKNNEFDVVLGHSQGAILIASLLALKRVPYHPSKGYIFNGVSFPNPYIQNLNDFEIGKGGDSPPPPCILFILGRKDKITPNSSGEQLREAFAKAGCTVTSCYHDGGHCFPEGRDDKAIESIVDWMMQGKI